MRSASPLTRSQRALALTAAVLCTVGLTAVGVVADVSIVVVVAGLVALGAGVVLFVVPAHWLPAIAVWVFAFVPARFIPNDGPFRALPALTLIMVIWVFRRVILRQGAPDVLPGEQRYIPPATRLWVYVPAVILVVWLAFSVYESRNANTSVAWSVSFLAALMAPMLVPDCRREGELVRTAFIWAGGTLGAYAFVEQLLGTSPIYGRLFDALGRTVERNWSVYRAFASFSHPLFAAAFFTVPSMLALGKWARTGRFLYLVLAGLAGLGVFATVSRGSIAAVGVGAAVVFVCCIFDPQIRVRGRMVGFVLLGVVGLVGASGFGPLQERANSLEGELSNGARELGIDVALKAAAHSHWLGSGPGTSGQTARIFDDVVIENSMLQLLISIGIPGLLLLAAILGGVILNALQARDFGAAAAVVALAVAFTGFNAIDAVFYLHLLIGMLVLLGLSATPPPPTDPLADARSRRNSAPSLSAPPTAFSGG